MIFTSIRAYKLYNYFLRTLAMFAVLALLVGGFTEASGKLVWLALAFAVFVADYITGGQPLKDKRIFIADPEVLDLYTVRLEAKGYRRLDDEKTYFVKRSKYLRVFIGHMAITEGHLLVEAPKKTAESLHLLGVVNASRASGVS